MGIARKRDVWGTQRRHEQTPPPGNWRIWLLMAGRGFGKTRVGAEYIRERVQKGSKRLALVGATAADVRDTMIEGESGVLAVCERYGIKCEYKASRKRIEFSNGAKAFTYSADEPNRLRGPQHEDAWGDEIGAWRYGADALSNLDFGLRLGAHPRLVLTSTPRVVPIVKDLMKRAILSIDGAVVMTRGSTRDNAANLPPATLRAWEEKYGGTRLGRQELEGELLEDVEGALWQLTQIDALRLPELPLGIFPARVVVGVDPAASSEEGAAETGIVVACLASDNQCYVMADFTISDTPSAWATRVVEAYDRFQADHVTPEVNNGGDMVTQTLRTVRSSLPIHPVWASRGKVTRAEPVSALYEQGRVHHIGEFKELEDQMCTWVPGMRSPDRMDALVWAITDLMLDPAGDFEETPDNIAEELLLHGLG